MVPTHCTIVCLENKATISYLMDICGFFFAGGGVKIEIEIEISPEFLFKNFAVHLIMIYIDLCRI